MKNLLYLIFFALACCTAAKKDEVGVNNAAPSDDFETFINMLPKLPLPFKVNCEKCCEHPKIDGENQLLEKYTPEGSAIVGLISKTEKYVIVLVSYAADLRVPSVKIFDRSGNIVAEKDFMTGYCGGDGEMFTRQFLTINTDLTITTSDTTVNIERDTVKYDVVDTTSIEVDRRNFIINGEGVIQLTDSSTIKI